MRARREAANCRARLGTAPPTAAELMELAGDDKASGVGACVPVGRGAVGGYAP